MNGVALDGASDQVEGSAIDIALHLECISAALRGIYTFIVSFKPAIEVDLRLLHLAGRGIAEGARILCARPCCVEAGIAADFDQAVACDAQF